MAVRSRPWMWIVALALLAGALPCRAGQPGEPAAESAPYWLRARELVHRKVMDLLVRHQGELARGLRFAKILRGDPALREVAITFDDGPHPKYTPRLLQILRRYQTPATFFVVGEQAVKYPDLVRQEVAEGHCVGNHTYHHVNLTRIPPDKVATEIKACGEALLGLTGRPLRLFRPPGGDYDDAVAKVSEALGYKMVLWTDNPGDYRSPGTALVEEHVLKGIDNGGIVLLHDGVEETVTALPVILEALQKRGYRFVTIDQMMADQRPRPGASVRATTGRKASPTPARRAAAGLPRRTS